MTEPFDGPLLRTEDVDVVRDGRYLLRGISLEIQPGQHWALLGPNGAGKSTLLALLGAVSHPTRGSVDVLGRRLGRVDVRELRAHLGHVNPRHPLRSPLSVREVVLTGHTNTIEPEWHRKPAPEALDRAEQLIETLGMGAMAEAPWTTLSQGERGRALIARALMPSPRLLLLDEPATGLASPPASCCWTAWTCCATSTRSWPACWSPTTWRSCRRAPPTPCCCAGARAWRPGRWTR